ncbi:unnamed protein product [Scytosiphon promiscuus]
MSAAREGQPPPPPQRLQPEAFVPEDFCDEVYGCMDDNLADAVEAMERELLEAVPKTEGADRDGGAGRRSSIEASIKTCCDNVQKRLQKEFDKNLDIFDRYVKMNVAAVADAVASGPAATEATVAALAGVKSGDRGNGVAPAGVRGTRDEGAGLTAPTTADAGTGGGARGGGSDGTTVVEGGGSSVPPSEKGRRPAAREANAWALDEEDLTPPKRLEEEEALDAEIQQLRKRRREGLRRCAAMVRKGAREAAVLEDVSEFVEAITTGVANSFDDNGLAPVGSKVQEAVQSCAELRATANLAQELTRRLEHQAEQNAGIGGGASGSGASSAGGAVASTVPIPMDLQAMYERSSEHQVVAGSAADHSAVESKLRG